MIPAHIVAVTTTTGDLLCRIEQALARVAPGCTVHVSTRDDDPDQPLPIGVWIDGPGGIDLIGSGEVLSEALSDALEEVRTWA